MRHTAATVPALRRLRRPVSMLIGAGTALGALGALNALVPFIGIVALARALLAPQPRPQYIVAVSGCIVAGLVLGWVAVGYALWLTHLADYRLQTSLRRALIDRLGKVPLGWYSANTSGPVRKAVQDDLVDLHHLTAHHDVERAGAFALPAGGILYLCWLDWRLAVLAILTWPVYAVAYAWMMRGFSEKMVRLDESFGAISSAIVEFVHGIAVVKAFGESARAHKAYQLATETFASRYAGWVRPVIQLEALTSMALSVPVILLTSLSGGVWMIHQGWITPVDLLAEVLVAMAMPHTLETLNQSLVSYRRAQAAAQRIEALLDLQTLPRADHPEIPVESSITFENVGFDYGRGVDVLKGVTFKCQPGTLTALVGASGAGKSTLARLVPRFYDVTQGSIRIGGVDVRAIDPACLYRHVGFVLQDVQLVHGTVADNLRLGCPDASDTAMEAAAQAARIHDRIAALPRGYASVVGEDALLSGGEMQRLAIARMLLADTPILILDEATAHADPESEAQVQDALSVLAQGRTVLVIAHRLASIVDADQIIVLAEGQLVECGTHAELLSRAGPYSQMWSASASSEGDCVNAD
ncbi:ABC transporter [Acetobacter orientalis]|uniref:ABC transporter n=2 Tax=Acetobacter orientalis TaxID=146474 RepID=A0A252AZC6_9PROT|nr:ABC transporter [Acetobacter orientalis]